MSVGRNKQCPCGSGKKSKRCCLNKQSEPNPIIVLEQTLPELKAQISPSIPRLQISMRELAGEYIFFHPGLFNLRSRWAELIQCGQRIETGLLNATMYEIHHRVLKEKVLSMVEIDRQAGYAYLRGTIEERQYHAENTVNHLFSLREKVANLVHDFISAKTNKALDHTKVSFGSIQSMLSNLAGQISNAKNNQLISSLTDIYSRFDDDEVQKLLDFRHGVVHRFTPGVEREQPAIVFLSKAAGDWDMLQRGQYRYRYFAHLSHSVWRKYISPLRRLATALDWTPYGFRLEVGGENAPSNLEAIVHSRGLGLTTRYGKMLINCMKQCRGYKMKVITDPPITSMEDPRLQQVRSDIDKLLPALFENTEEQKTTFLCVLSPPGSGLLALTFLTESTRVESLADVESEMYERVQTGEPGEWVSLEETKDKLSSQGWSAEAVDALIRFAHGDQVVYPVSKAAQEPREARYRLVLKRQVLVGQRVADALTIVTSAVPVE